MYYVGLLAGENDLQLLARSGVGRDINRHYYQRDEITDAMRKPVVKQLCELIRLRNTHAAFNGQFVCRTESANKLQLRWQSGAEYAELSIDFGNDQHHLQFSTAEGVGNIEFYAAKPGSKLPLSYGS